MNPSQLLTHFDRISDAPGGVPRLRQFILDLSVRGKLVAQNPTDLPASSQPNQGSLPENAPYRIPLSWIWARVGEVADCRLGKMLDKGKNRGTPRRYLRNVNVRWFDFDLSDVFEMPFEDSELDEFALREGDVLICEGGEPGRAAVWDQREASIYFQKAVHRVRFSPTVDSHFFVNVLRVSADSGRLATYFTGVGIKHFTGKGLASFLFPVPPIAEQHRIVAKVDELMALCDRLEAAYAERESRRERLVTVSLQRLNRPADNAAAFREHACFHIRHLPRLTTRVEHVQQLRQTVLNLAVYGRLVPQNLNDEPVTLALASSDRARQFVAKEDRRADSGLQTLLAAEERWESPPSWQWRALADLVLFIDYRGQTPNKVDYGVRLVTAKNVRKGLINRSPQEFLSEENYHTWMTRGFPNVGDVLFTTEAPMGNAAVVRMTERFALAQRVICFRPYGAVNSDFLVLQLLAEPFQSILDKTATGLTAKGIKAAKLKRRPIVVPPPAEQHRIVAKVDELMTVCDRLEAQLTATQTESRRLLEAVLHEALHSRQSTVAGRPSTVDSR